MTPFMECWKCAYLIGKLERDTEEAKGGQLGAPSGGKDNVTKPKCYKLYPGCPSPPFPAEKRPVMAGQLEQVSTRRPSVPESRDVPLHTALTPAHTHTHIHFLHLSLSLLPRPQLQPAICHLSEKNETSKVGRLF